MEYQFMDKVRIKEGFYKDIRGILVEKRPDNLYMIECRTWGEKADKTLPNKFIIVKESEIELCNR